MSAPLSAIGEVTLSVRKPWTVTLWRVAGRDVIFHDQPALGQALGLRGNHLRRVGLAGMVRRRVMNCRGQIRTAYLAPPAAAAKLFAIARELGRPGVDEAEAAFAAAWWAATDQDGRAAA